MILLAWLSGCATDPGPGAVFRDEVVPALERSCASGSCHGVAPGSAESGEIVNWGLLHFPIDEAGTITDLTWTYQATKRAINTSEDPAFSSLLRKPLSTTFGGTPHYGGENYASTDVGDYQVIYDWIAMETGGGEDPEPLSDLEQLFADTVQPALQGVSCGNGNCHGSSSGVPFHLDGGVAGEVPIAGTRANYKASRKMLSLEGAPEQSRLLRKSLPLHEGGIVHKGGNDAFFDGLDDPRAQAMMDWACAEQAALLGTECGAGPQVSGFVFVRGEVGPRDVFDLDVYAPGTDIWLARAAWPDLEVTETVDLTGALHGGEGDVRDPAVDPAGERMLFSMRLGPDEGHAIYVMELASGEATQLTEPGGAMAGGGLWTDRDPTWGPDGHVWFVSTREGVIADDGERLDAELYELDPATGELSQRSWTPHIERRPIFLTMGKVAGEIAFTVLRDAVPGQAHAHPFRFPPDMHLEYHQHFGTTPDQNLHHDLRETADGRYLIIQGDLGTAWEGGSLAIIDRNFGPEINHLSTSQDPSLPFYAPPCLMVDPDAATIYGPGTLYRDPAGLPDGRALVATAPDVDLLDPAADVELGITVVTLSDSPDGSGPRLVGATRLLDEPGVDEFDPEPVAILRPAPVADGLAWDPSSATGIFYHQGMPMIDAILSNLSPSGSKTIPDDFRWARIIEALPMSAAQCAAMLPLESVLCVSAPRRTSHTTASNCRAAIACINGVRPPPSRQSMLASESLSPARKSKARMAPRPAARCIGSMPKNLSENISRGSCRSVVTSSLSAATCAGVCASAGLGLSRP